MKRNKYRLIDRALGYKMIIPATVLLALIIFYPLISGIIMSFKNYNLLRPDEVRFIGLGNYFNIIFKDTEFRGVLFFSFLYTVGVVLFSYLVGLGLAMLLKRDIKFRGLFRTLVLIPWVIPPVVACTNWLWVLNDQVGIVNVVLKQLHIIKSPILFLGSETLARITVIFTGTWKSYPFMMIVILAGLQSIPKEMYEASKIDGANIFQSFIYITMPMIKSVSFICTTLMFIWTFNNFDNIYLLTKGGPLNQTFVMPILSYYTAFYRTQFGYASAIAVVMLVVLLILSLLYLRLLKTDKDN